jgi:ADP-ribose pyrophosphatase YjhB (NUDIX family)/MOSC domain-containing protein YiiM
LSDQTERNLRGENSRLVNPALGVGVLVMRAEELLLGLRVGVHGGATWSVPGGNVEVGESPEAAARRELQEETGLEAGDGRVVAETDDIFPGGLLYHTFFVRVEGVLGEPVGPGARGVRALGLVSLGNLAPAALPPGREPARNGVSTMSAPGPDASPDNEVESPEGVVEAIHIALDAGEPVRPLELVRAIAGVGLEGDRYALGRGHYQDARVSRALTLIEAEAVEELAADHGIRLSVGASRRNITTRGIRLNDLVDCTFWVGEVLCRGTRLCEPCQYLADLTGKPLLRALVHRGGLRADILRSGFIRRGDVVRSAERELRSFG